jgi:hypothetical protein
MRTLTRLATGAIALGALLALISSTASASRALSIRPGGPIFAEGPVTISEPLRVANIICELHLEGVLRGVVPKIARLPEGEMGQLTRLEFIGCVETFRRVVWTISGLVEPGSPSPVLYQSFLGTLPSISGVLALALSVGIRIRGGMVDCLFKGDLPYLIGRLSAEPLFNLKRFLANRLPLFRTIEMCPVGSFLEISGTLIIRPGQMITLM